MILKRASTSWLSLILGLVLRVIVFEAESTGALPLDAIVSGSSGLCIDVFEGSVADRVKIVQSKCTDARSQQFSFDPDSGGYRIIASHSSKCLGVGGGSLTSGAIIEQQPCKKGSPSQIWQVSGSGSSRRLKVLHTDYCLSVSEGSVADGAHVIQYPCVAGEPNELWRIDADLRMDHPGYTVTPNLGYYHTEWQGWGTGLSWLGVGIGASQYEKTYADVLFTTNYVKVLPSSPLVPGLGLTIARFNPGGSGKPGDSIPENLPRESTADKVWWFRDVDGYWLDWNSRDPQSASWDWTRDPNQRSLMMAASSRGVNIEFIFLAPMWWMTTEKTSYGGTLQPWNYGDFAYYMATVAKYAESNWGIKVKAVAPFNEPSAGWWRFPIRQQGLNLNFAQQTELLHLLRAELDFNNMDHVQIAASDENTITQAIEGFKYFQKSSVDHLVDQVAVHAYSGLDPFRDNKARETLSRVVGQDKPISVSEYGDNDAGGMTLAQTITEDIIFLKASSWTYWQTVEPYSGWGLILGNYGNDGQEFASNRGEPYVINNKYYIFAQFTRSLRPGDRVYSTNDHNTVVAYDPVKKQLKFITVNYGNPQFIKYDLSGISLNGRALASLSASSASGDKKMKKWSQTIVRNELGIAADENTVYSIVIHGVKSVLTNPQKLVVAHSNMCMQPEGGSNASGAHIVQAICKGSPTQNWFRSGTQLVHEASRMCLIVDEGSMNNGAASLLWECSGAPYERFAEANGTLIAEHSGKCLNVAAESTTAGAWLIQWACSAGAANKQFKLVQ